MIPPSFEEVGRLRRVNRWLSAPFSIMAAIDDALLAGPSGHLGNIDEYLSMLAEAGIDGVLGFPGAFRNASRLQFSFVVNLSASIDRHEGRESVCKARIGSVRRAVQLGADGVAVHLNPFGETATQSLRLVSQIIESAGQFGMPVMVIAYGRGLVGGRRDDPPLTTHEGVERAIHALRIAVELGADVVKCRLPRDVASAQAIVEHASGIPVLAAGGPLGDSADTVLLAQSFRDAGAAGVCFGRRLFLSDSPKALIHSLRQSTACYTTTDGGEY